jgi:uncharacterized cupin superfamily protein
MRPVLFAAGILAAGCAPYEPVSTAESSLTEGAMIVYPIGHSVPASELIDLGPPSGLGATVLEGDPRISARIDYAENGMTAGVFQGTRGKALIHFPFTEHATILFGQATLTDQAGNTHVFKPGDSYLIRQGSDVLLDVEGSFFQKSFFNRVEPADAPGPMKVYPLGVPVPASELMDLGSPSNLGGTVLEGDPTISARVDYAGGGLTAGVFQATQGKGLIHFPFTEHASFFHGQARLTDESGVTHVFNPGDSYLIKQGSNIVWDTSGRSVQKSFFNFAQP